MNIKIITYEKAIVKCMNVYYYDRNIFPNSLLNR